MRVASAFRTHGADRRTTLAPDEGEPADLPALFRASGSIEILDGDIAARRSA
jgi:hypothetical protein